MGRRRIRRGRLWRRRIRWRRWTVRGRRSERFMVMTRKKLLRIIDRERVKAAIESAEHETSGEICVSVAPLFWGNIEKAADKAFLRMGMTHTKERNGVLFF